MVFTEAPAPIFTAVLKTDLPETKAENGEDESKGNVILRLDAHHTQVIAQMKGPVRPR